MKNWLKVLVIYFIFGLFIYFNSLNNKFLIDDLAFLRNPVMSQLKFVLSQWDPYREQAMGVLDKHESLPYYRPMTHMVYNFIYAAFKGNYWQYHLLNLFTFLFKSHDLFMLVLNLLLILEVELF